MVELQNYSSLGALVHQVVKFEIGGVPLGDPQLVLVTREEEIGRKRKLGVTRALRKGVNPSKCPNKRAMILRDDGEIESDNSHGETSTSSSCVNVASERLVNKLSSLIIVHLKLYRLQWLSEHGELIVEVSFTLGKYEDKVLCNVAPIEATHLLLGRHYQYDRKVIQDGALTGSHLYIWDKSKKEEKSKESLLVGPREVRRVLLAKREPLYALPIDMYDSFAERVLGLPPLRGIKYYIDLSLRATLPNMASHKTNPEEGKQIQKQVGKLLEKGWVTESMSPCAMLVILVPKKDGTWRMCTNYSLINKITVRYRHLIPSLDDLLDELHGKGGDEWKTTFKTKFGLYEWLVMPFGLTNAPSTFIRLMNHVLRSLTARCVIVYFDDILICSTCLNVHLLHVRSLLEILRKETLFSSLEKCIFYTDEVVFLGFVVGSHGVKIDNEDVKAS
ncbi:hypothetical protein CR513_18976, partial [Mucuna pruriens]